MLSCFFFSLIGTYRTPEYPTLLLPFTSYIPLYYSILLHKHQWNTKWAFPRKLHIFTREDNMLSSHVKRSPSLWLHNKSRLWKQADLVFHWCLYNKQNITYSLMDMNFIFSCSTRYLTRSQRSLVRYRVGHSKIKFLSARGHVISSMYSFLLHLILFLSRFNFQSCLYHRDPDKNISECHSDSASNVPQLPAVNQRVQTGVYKHQRYRILMQDDFNNYFLGLHSKFSEYLWQIAS